MISLSDFNYTLYDQNDRLSFLRQLIANFGNPDRNFKIIHVAGTNGKGSTATMIARILAHHGYKVGLFTSPHIIDNCESITVNGQKITIAQMQHWIQKVVKVITAQLGLDPLKGISQFEILFIVALLFSMTRVSIMQFLNVGSGVKRMQRMQLQQANTKFLRILPLITLPNLATRWKKLPPTKRELFGRIQK